MSWKKLNPIKIQGGDYSVLIDPASGVFAAQVGKEWIKSDSKEGLRTKIEAILSAKSVFVPQEVILIKMFYTDYNFEAEQHSMVIGPLSAERMVVLWSPDGNHRAVNRDSWLAGNGDVIALLQHGYAYAFRGDWPFDPARLPELPTVLVNRQDSAYMLIADTPNVWPLLQDIWTAMVACIARARDILTPENIGAAAVPDALLRAETIWQYIEGKST